MFFGTTAYVADPHEIANVCGEAGIEFIHDDIKDIPADIKLMMPSTVPASDYDYNGASFDSKKTKEMIKKYHLAGLGEMMDITGILNDKEDTLKKMEGVGIVDGHAPLMRGKTLDKYLSAQILTDHETISKEEALEKVSKGLYVLIREGSAAKNLTEVIKAVNANNISRFCFATDDKNVFELKAEGTMRHNIRRAIECGLDPIDAIRIATINAYTCYQMPFHGAIAPGYHASMVVADNLNLDHILEVYYEGRMVAKDNKPLFTPKKASTRAVEKTVHIDTLLPSDFRMNKEEIQVGMRIQKESLITEPIDFEAKTPYNRVALVERHN